MPGSVTHSNCKKCLLCIAICPAKILSIDPEGFPSFIDKKKHTCLHCGQCMAICTSGAIQINGLDYNTHLFPLPELKTEYNNFCEVLAHRRSVRNFSTKPVEEEKIDLLLEALAMAPYGASANSVHITVINNRRVIEQTLPAISGFYNNVEKWMKNPFMRYMIRKNAGLERFRTIDHHLLPRIKLGHYRYPENSDNITRNAPCMMIFHAAKEEPEHTEDSFILVSIASLTAVSLGLGSTIIGLVGPAVNKNPDLKKTLGIPENHEVVTSLILGYPKYKFRKGIKRPKVNVNRISG